MKNLLLGGIALIALAVPAAIAAADESSSRVEAIEKENAVLRKENAALRERTKLQKENTALRERVGLGESSPSREPPPTSAYATYLPLKAPPPVIYDWTGLYIGGHVGWETARTQGSMLSIAPTGQGCLDPVGTLCAAGGTVQTPADQKLSGWLGGAQFGYNHQFRRAVVGLELSGSWGDVKNQTTGAMFTPAGGIPVVGSLACYKSILFRIFPVSSTDTLTCNDKQDWTAQALARLGYTFMDGRFLPYVTAGVAFSHLQATRALVAAIPGAVFAPVTWGASRQMVGAVIGFGAQYALGYNVSIGAEYLYTNYGSKDFTSIASNNPFDIAGPPVQETHDLRTQTVRVLLNYKFTD
jgi:outer membrane immunogenic protein